MVGSVIGGFVFRFLGLPSYGTPGAILTAVIGAILLIAILRMVRHA